MRVRGGNKLKNFSQLKLWLKHSGLVSLGTYRNQTSLRGMQHLQTVFGYVLFSLIPSSVVT